MADIGSLILPDSNLLANYEQSFQRQMALKKYIVEKSEAEEEKFYKQATFTPDDAIGAVRGQQDALLQKAGDYQNKLTQAYGDMKHGLMFRIDPKRMAELEGEKLKLESEQAQRLQSIKNLNTAAAIMTKPGAEGLYDVKSFEDYKKRIQKGEFVDPSEEALVHLPTNGGKILDDMFKGVKPEEIYSPLTKKGNEITGKVTPYFPEIAGEKYDPKTYVQQGYDYIHNRMTSTPALSWSMNQNFKLFARDNPDEASKLVADHGSDAPWALFSAQNKGKIESVIQGSAKPIKPTWREGRQISPYTVEREQEHIQKMTLSPINAQGEYDVPTESGAVQTIANVPGKGLKGALITSANPKKKEITYIYQDEKDKPYLTGKMKGEDAEKIFRKWNRLGYKFSDLGELPQTKTVGKGAGKSLYTR